ncbi:hypothetical protein OU994_25180 [Pseudoduganella sp. SL102]|uniref:hypothetical protein n=1 Tax=Pseudoduganella sp. SL102 TaxID=2995154 RepID=UPI00248AE19D|nr:hypothetical protein [Pseudoduganella sp. SL102]WBS01536.1 hypothetical protein OU994_25180 [Pseudoduganella sp. SL102]
MKINNSTYMDWLKALPADDGTLRECACPACGSLGLAYQYFGFRDSNFGWKLIWCEVCKHGINISRTRIPESAHALVEESEQAEFNRQHSEIRLIS